MFVMRTMSDCVQCAPAPSFEEKMMLMIVSLFYNWN